MGWMRGFCLVGLAQGVMAGPNRHYLYPKAKAPTPAALAPAVAAAAPADAASEHTIARSGPSNTSSVPVVAAPQPWQQANGGAKPRCGCLCWQNGPAWYGCFCWF